MYIKRLTLENFRCFDSFSLEFGSNCTILIGKNGSGKSNVLDGLVYALSFPFAKIKKIGSFPSIADSSTDLNIGKLDHKGSYDARFNKDTKDFEYPISIKGEVNISNNFYDFALIKLNKTGGLRHSYYEKAFTAFNKNYSQEALPVLAYFADNYPHLEANNPKDIVNRLTHSEFLPKNLGYYQWDKKTSCAKIWSQRFIHAYSRTKNIEWEILSLDTKIKDFPKKNDPTNDTVLLDLTDKRDQLAAQLQVDPFYNEIEFIKKGLRQFSNYSEKFISINQDIAIENIEASIIEKIDAQILFHFVNGHSIFFDKLPMGYRRIFSIVFEILYRSYLLNGDSDPQGIVIIDEVDLHLHPKLQSDILNRLISCFPKIQFIVTTHSPLVLSNFAQNNIYNHRVYQLMHEEGKFKPEPIPNLYGIAYRSCLEDIMGADASNAHLETLSFMYRTYKENNLQEEANRVKSEIEKMGHKSEFILEKFDMI